MRTFLLSLSFLVISASASADVMCAKRNGAMFLRDACRIKERAVDYAELQGPQGEPGEQGPAGPAGPAGPTGATGPATVSYGLWDRGDPVTLPVAGKYAIFANFRDQCINPGITCENCLGLGTLYTYNSTGNEQSVIRVIDVALAGARLFSTCDGVAYSTDVVAVQVR